MGLLGLLQVAAGSEKNRLVEAGSEKNRLVEFGSEKPF